MSSPQITREKPVPTVKVRAIRDENRDMLLWAIFGLALFAIATFAILTVG